MEGFGFYLRWREVWQTKLPRPIGRPQYQLLPVCLAAQCGCVSELRFENWHCHW